MRRLKYNVCVINRKYSETCKYSNTSHFVFQVQHNVITLFCSQSVTCNHCVDNKQMQQIVLLSQFRGNVSSITVTLSYATNCTYNVRGVSWAYITRCLCDLTATVYCWSSSPVRLRLYIQKHSWKENVIIQKLKLFSQLVSFLRKLRAKSL